LDVRLNDGDVGLALLLPNPHNGEGFTAAATIRRLH